MMSALLLVSLWNDILETYSEIPYRWPQGGDSAYEMGGDARRLS